MPNAEKTAVEIAWILDTTIREDIYEDGWEFPGGKIEYDRGQFTAS